MLQVKLAEGKLVVRGKEVVLDEILFKNVVNCESVHQSVAGAPAALRLQVNHTSLPIPRHCVAARAWLSCAARTHLERISSHQPQLTHSRHPTRVYTGGRECGGIASSAYVGQRRTHGVAGVPHRADAHPRRRVRRARGPTPQRRAAAQWAGQPRAAQWFAPPLCPTVCVSLNRLFHCVSQRLTHTVSPSLCALSPRAHKRNWAVARCRQSGAQERLLPQEQPALRRADAPQALPVPRAAQRSHRRHRPSRRARAPRVLPAGRLR